MFLTALCFLAGILCLNLFTELPGVLLYAACLISAAVWYPLRHHPVRHAMRALAVLLFGMSWAQIHANHYLQQLLPESLAGADIVVTGSVSGIPVNDDTVQRFVFEVRAFNAVAYAGPVPYRLKLSWYHGETVHAGETWQFTVRLKPPHGFMNPGGFDYEAWLYQHDIHATGYVRSNGANRKLANGTAADGSVIRGHIAERIAAALPESAFAGLVTALAVGDRSGIGPDQWRVLINTGTNHLMAISGLHIGLAAAFGYGICRRLPPVKVMSYVPAQHLGMIGAIGVACVYAMLAGFAIPTQRALLMLICVAGAALFRRTTRPGDVLCFALIIVLLWDPVSVMSAGFWFSFLAVAVIFYTFTGCSRQSRWLQWGWLQVVIALALFPLSLFLFQQVSLVSPLANALMVPYVSLLVVPVILFGVLVSPLSDAAAALLFSWAGGLFDLIWPVVQWLSDMPGSHWIRAQPSLLLTVLALAGVAVLLAPRIGYRRFSGALLLLPALIAQPKKPATGAYELNVLDVGQGLAVVVMTRSHTLVYDTGARFSDRLDSGAAVLLPFLRHRGVEKIDLLMISHGDGDHIGGAASLLDAFPETPVLGRGIDRLTARSSDSCRAGQRWQWDGIVFSVLHPDEADYRSTNNQSCVLRIESPGGSVLIAGDIEKKIENKLLGRYRTQLAADILIAPHHGSTTSSTADFIEAVAARHVIFAAGYRNRYRFPAESVVRRYRKDGAHMYTSGHSGAIKVLIDPRRGVSAVERYRETHGKYWHHRAPGLRQDG